MTTVFYPGSFDPVTFGHLDVIARGARLFGRVVVGIGVHHAKKTLFDGDERAALLREAIGTLGLGPDVVEVTSFDGLVVEAARAAGASAILRGLRNGSDFDYEEGMAGMNRAVAPDVETLYLGAGAGVRHIASSLVKQIAALGGDVGAFVPPQVAETLALKYRKPG